MKWYVKWDENVIVSRLCMSHMNSYCHYLEFCINQHTNSYSYMNSYDGRLYNLSMDIRIHINLYYGHSYNLSAKLSTDIWIRMSLWILMSVVTKPICSCQDKNMNSHVHLNSYVTNNKFPKNNIIILCLIKFFLQNPTTSMRNWVCPHKS